MKLQQLLLVAMLCLQAFGAFIWDATQIIKQRASDNVQNVSTMDSTPVYC